MKQFIFFIILVILLNSCENDMKLKPNNLRLRKVITYNSVHKSEIKGFTTFEYDLDGNLTKEITYGMDTLNPASYTVFENENGKKAREFRFYTTHGGLKQAQEIYYQYMDSLLLKEELKASENMKVINFTEYKYDQSGQLIFKSLVQTEPFACWKTVYEYNANHQKIKTISFDQSVDTSGHIEHFYNGNLLSNERIYTASNELCYEYNYFYDYDNKLLEKTKTIKGVTKPVESLEYINPYIIEKTVYDWDYNKGFIYSFKYIQVFEYE